MSSVAFTPLQNLFGIITPSRRALRAPSRGHARRRSAPAPADDPRPRGAAARLHDGRPHALPVGVAHPLHRVRREHRHGMGQRRRADRAVHARHAGVQRVDRRAAVDAARRGRHRPQAGEVRAGRRRRRRGADAHDPDRDGARRRARRLRPERRDAAAGAGLSAAPARARRAGRVERQVAAPDRGRRPAVEHARGVAALRRPDARRHAPPVHVDPGGEERDHRAVGRPGAARPRLPRDHRARVVGARQGPARRRVDRRRPQLAHRAPAGARPHQGADALSHRLDLGRRRRRCCRAVPSTRPATCSRPCRQLRAVRGTRSIYHNNAIQTWRVADTAR